MPTKVICAPAAKRELEQAKRQLHQPGAGERAHRRWLSIRKTLRTLRADPTRRGVGDHAGAREVSVAEYRILYTVAITLDAARTEVAGDVAILRVFGPGQERTRLQGLGLDFRRKSASAPGAPAAFD